MRWTVYFTSLSLLVAAILFAVYYRFTHPELSETQLFIKLWPLTVLVFCVGLLYKLYTRKS